VTQNFYYVLLRSVYVCTTAPKNQTAKDEKTGASCCIKTVHANLKIITMSKDNHKKEGDGSVPSGEYNIRRIYAPTLNGVLLWLFAKLLRTYIGGFIIEILKQTNDFACVVRLMSEEEYHHWMPLYYPLPEERDESQYQKHVELSQEFDLQDFISTCPSSDAATTEKAFRYWSIEDYLTKYKNQDLTPSQVALAIFKAVKDSDGQSTPIRAIVVMNEAEILEHARDSTERYRKNCPLGPLDGVPVAIKEEVDVKGYQTTQGTTFLGDLGGVKDQDCSIAAKLRHAGALIVGKTNMHEFGIGLTGYNWHYGPSRNPHNPKHYTGGSSGGSAAAVAAGLVPLAVGLDGGGSIRVPSSLCGVVGLKPTFSRGGMDMPICPSVGHIGPIACSVKDAAIGYAVMAGPLEGEQEVPKPTNHYPSPPPIHLSSFIKDQDLKDVKIGIFDDFFRDADTEIVSVCSSTVQHLESLGAQVIKIRIPHLDETSWAHRITVLTELAEASTRFYADSIHKFTPETQISFELGRSLDSVSFIAAQKFRRYAMSVLDSVFSQVDIFLTPGTGTVAPTLQKSAESYGESNLEMATNLMRFIAHGNFCGIPGIAVPVGYSADKKLPIALLIQTRHWEEDVILRIAKACEALVPHRKPMIYYDIMELASKEPKDDCLIEDIL
jgi:Asp-tRNA(Asn)/Glu-tRNA(Gln) amidotransferase A subunit family amidase